MCLSTYVPGTDLDKFMSNRHEITMLVLENYQVTARTQTMSKLFLPLSIFIFSCTSSFTEAQNKPQNPKPKATSKIGDEAAAVTLLRAEAPAADGSDRDAEVRAANDQFYAALNAMFKGELAPMNAIWSHSDDVSNQGPFGARMDGWQAVGAQFKREAAMKLGGRVSYKNLIVQTGRDLAYTVCVEIGENMTAAGKPVHVSHRATNIFRREKGQWRLIHHHTDLAPQLGKTDNK